VYESFFQPFPTYTTDKPRKSARAQEILSVIEEEPGVARDRSPIVRSKHFGVVSKYSENSHSDRVASADQSKDEGWYQSKIEPGDQSNQVTSPRREIPTASLTSRAQQGSMSHRIQENPATERCSLDGDSLKKCIYQSPSCFEDHAVHSKRSDQHSDRKKNPLDRNSSLKLEKREDQLCCERTERLGGFRDWKESREDEVAKCEKDQEPPPFEDSPSPQVSETENSIWNSKYSEKHSAAEPSRRNTEIHELQDSTISPLSSIKGSSPPESPRYDHQDWNRSDVLKSSRLKIGDLNRNEEAKTQQIPSALGNVQPVDTQSQERSGPIDRTEERDVRNAERRVSREHLVHKLLDHNGNGWPRRPARGARAKPRDSIKDMKLIDEALRILDGEKCDPRKVSAYRK